MNVIFMGTPDFAVAALQELLSAGHGAALVVTQPDKPRGRRQSLQYPPVKEFALSHGIEVFQPVRIREPENVEYLRKYGADIIVVAAFGQILPKEILEMPKYGCINIHASLLPKYRGAAPIQWALINGDPVTGVTIQRMDAGVDTGDIIAEREVPIAPDETGESLFEKLSDAGAKLCVQTMDMIENGTARYTPQNHEEATHAPMITKELGRIDWNKSAGEIECLVRGLNPWPCAYTFLERKILKIWKSAAVGGASGLAPGTVARVTKDEIRVQTGDGLLVLLEVQLEGKKRMECGAFLRGNPVKEGTVL